MKKKTEILKDIKRTAQEDTKKPNTLSIQEYSQHGEFSPKEVTENFTSFKQALEKANVEPVVRRH